MFVNCMQFPASLAACVSRICSRAYLGSGNSLDAFRYIVAFMSQSETTILHISLQILFIPIALDAKSAQGGWMVSALSPQVKDT
jgi:hypothetical protein